MLVLAFSLASFVFPRVAYSQDGQSVISPGCSDLTPTPVPPGMDSHTTFFDDWYYVTYAIVVTEASGICVVEELEGTGIDFCDQAVPCAPRVTITANIDDDTVSPWYLNWEVTGSGYVGHDSQSGPADRGNGDGVATLYDKNVRVQCGESMSTTANFKITSTPSGGYIGTPTPNHDYTFDFACTSCAGVIIHPL